MAEILLIEDNLNIRENTVEILELEGYTVRSAKNGMCGLELAKAFGPDIILCDIQMPKMNGYELLEVLKRDPQTSIIPFIFFTVSTEPKAVKRGLKMGADAYIKKPFEVRDLLDTIDRCLL